MKDLTQGSITRQIVAMSLPIVAGMIFQTLYIVVDLKFVSALGNTAIAGVSAAGNVAFVIFALTQVLGVGTVALISQAAGRKDQTDANVVFNQSLTLSAMCGLVVIVAGYPLTQVYLNSIAADAATVSQGIAYLCWFLPGLALQFAMIALGSALRGTGIVKPTMVVQMLGVVINIILAPVLIAGWGTDYPLGAAGAGLASSIAAAASVILLWNYFHRLEHYVAIDKRLLRPQLLQWRRILGIGLPAGGEMGLMFIYMGIVYWVIRHFGSSAQAGFGVGSRVMQSIFMPTMAIAFAAGPIAGQNFGAGRGDRVRETFKVAAILSTIVMATVTIVLQWQPAFAVRFFTNEPEVVAVGAQFLQLVSLNFIAQGIIFTCSSVFQGLGNTKPSLFSSAVRLTLFGIPAIWMGLQPGLQLRYVWYLSIATVTLQAGLSWFLLRREFNLKLNPLVSNSVAHA
jgi:putative MATE family efflux protein